MIATFDRYLLRVMFIAIMATLFFLLGVDFLVQSTERGDDLGIGKYTFAMMVYTQFLEIPQRSIEFMPAAVLVGTLMGLGQLGAQNELTIVRSSGVSRLKISRPGLFLALLLGVLLVVIGESLAPYASARSESIRNQALGRTTQPLYAEGVWVNDGQGAVHIGALNPDGSLGDLRFYRVEENGKVTIQHTVSAVYRENHWLLRGNRAFSLTPERVAPAESHALWKKNFTPKMLLRMANTESASTIGELLNLNHFLTANDLDHSGASLRLWQRLLLPLTTATMLLLALPFAFNVKRSGERGSRLVIGILLGVGYYMAQDIISRLCLLFHWLPIIGALTPIVLFALPPLFFLTRD